MRKAIALILGLALILSAAFAETAAETSAEKTVFTSMAELEWTFCSGAGAWSTDMRIREDGSFRGEYHDSDMGDIADEYPDGTMYFCVFTGQMSFVEQVDEYCWRIHIDEVAVEPAEETITDGIRYIPTDSYGISAGEDMLLYRPGTPVSLLSEEMQIWAHVLDYETPPLELEDWFLGSEKEGTGFVGYRPAVYDGQ